MIIGLEEHRSSMDYISHENLEYYSPCLFYVSDRSVRRTRLVYVDGETVNMIVEGVDQFSRFKLRNERLFRDETYHTYTRCMISMGDEYAETVEENGDDRNSKFCTTFIEVSINIR